MTRDGSALSFRRKPESSENNGYIKHYQASPLNFKGRNKKAIFLLDSGFRQNDSIVVEIWHNQAPPLNYKGKLERV